MFLQAGGISGNDGCRFDFVQPIYISRIFCRAAGNFDADFYMGARNDQGLGSNENYPVVATKINANSTYGINFNGSSVGASILNAGVLYHYPNGTRCKWMTLYRISATMQIEVYFTFSPTAT